MTLRWALIEGRGSTKQLAALLPDNYRVLSSQVGPTGKLVAIIEGEDNRGWNLDDYVLPRLASALFFGHEIVP